MKRLVVLLFVLTLLPIFNYAQNGWNWVSTPVDSTRRHIWDVHFFSSDTGWILSHADVGFGTHQLQAFTFDGGVEWDTIVFQSGPQSQSFDFWNRSLSICFDGAVLRTEDGWETWTKPFVDTIGFAGVGKFASANYVYAGGLNTIIKSTDSGITWEYIQPLGLEFGRISDISIIDTNIIYAICSDKLLKTEDGGLNWIEIALPDLTVRYWQVKFLTENYGWITGEFRTIYLTTDGGVNWIDQSPPVDYDAFRQFDALDELTAAAASSAGAIFWTTNGGATWVEQVQKEIYSLIMDIQIVTDSVAYAVGWYGTMLKTTTGGVTWIEEVNDLGIPSEYELKQNYPNPFNPATSIQYTIESKQYVQLRVYDILGNEIATLVNEEKPAGTYEVKFNASLSVNSGSRPAISSGVYYYQFQVGNYIETKKMILIK